MSDRPGIRVSEQYVEQTPGADPDATELVINLLVAANLVEHHLDRVLRPHGLTIGSFKLLQVIAGADEALTPTQLRARFETPVTTATITGVLDTLEARGLIRRGPHPTDRRRVLVGITAEGRRVLSGVAPDLVEAEKAWTAPLGRADKRAAVDRLGALVDGLRASTSD
jgi:DNA-binding MarR family transcriptional regulator